MNAVRWIGVFVLLLTCVIVGVSVQYVNGCHSDGGNVHQTQWFYKCDKE